MPENNVSLLSRLSKKNIKDTVILGIVTIAIVAIILFVENKTAMVYATVVTLLVYYVQYQLSRNENLHYINKLVDNEFGQFQKLSEKVLELSEKERLLTHKYMQTLSEVMQTTKSSLTNADKTIIKTKEVAGGIRETSDSSEYESKSIQDNLVIMQNIKQRMQTIAELILELTDSVKQIGATVYIVENISEQTNMLALNAAVEAARAGEYGKGFAVVAAEIRKLADESKQATSKITSLVTEIEQTTSSTIMATEDGAKEIDNGVKFASAINGKMVNISTDMKNIDSEINDIIVLCIEHKNVLDKLLNNIEDMHKGISETINTLEENIQNIKDFSEISASIKENIAK